MGRRRWRTGAAGLDVVVQEIIDLGKAVILGGSAGSVLGMQEMLRTSQAYYTVSVNNADEAHKFMDALWAIPVSKSE